MTSEEKLWKLLSSWLSVSTLPMIKFVAYSPPRNINKHSVPSSAGTPTFLTEPQSAWNVRLGRRTGGLDMYVLQCRSKHSDGQNNAPKYALRDKFLRLPRSLPNGLPIPRTRTLRRKIRRKHLLSCLVLRSHATENWLRRARSSRCIRVRVDDVRLLLQGDDTKVIFGWSTFRRRRLHSRPRYVSNL